MKIIHKSAIFAIPFAITITGEYLFLNNKGVFNLLFGVLEEGMAEWVQFLAYFSAAALGFISHLKLNKTKKIESILLITFSAGCLFLALEEISYGQHLLKWETPETLSKINYQKETNIHNIEFIAKSTYFLYLVSFVYIYGAFSFIFKKNESPLSVKDIIFVDWYASSYFMVFIISFVFEKIFSLSDRWKIQELYETNLSLGFFVVAISIFSKTRLLLK